MSGIALDRDAVEVLAEQLYDASNSTNVPWARRDRLVRNWWRKAAEETLANRRADTAG
ncbi:MAG TPA: hypothetical protein VD978_29365 [Azospirillum sp.]|nr:hypothetical protein [Azospirillum sp.]